MSSSVCKKNKKRVGQLVWIISGSSNKWTHVRQLQHVVTVTWGYSPSVTLWALSDHIFLTCRGFMVGLCGSQMWSCSIQCFSWVRMVWWEQTAIVLLRLQLGPCSPVPKKGLFSWWHVSWNIPLELAFGNKSALSGSICMYRTEELLYQREFVWFGPLGMVERGSHASQASA